ncbi:hypothetical protein C0J52_20285 [Blattella germanica]|nr:hypothetical protein C0J52_20285 [Blattella germanica]
MDDTIELVDSEGSVDQVQSQLRTSASKQNFSCKQAADDSKKPTEDNNCNLTIIPHSPKLSPEENEGKLTTVSQVSAHFKERLNLKSGSGVNGIVNGIGVGVEFSHTAESEHLSIANGKTLKSETSSQCDKCEKLNVDGERSVTDYKSVSNCMKSDTEKSSRPSESVKCNEDRESKVDTAETQEDVKYVSYKSELQMPDIMRLIQKDLSEPYSIYTYRYFIHNWPKLCFLAMDGSECVGAIVCKLDVHRKVVKRGYIAMLAVDEKYRKRKIGSNLVLKAIRAMVADDADEVVLETEITNRPALRLYENLGFVRDKRLFRYYLNGVDALRLKLWLR